MGAIYCSYYYVGYSARVHCPVVSFCVCLNEINNIMSSEVHIN